MSQIDKLNYIPLLFWFLIFFIFLYFYLVLYILPFIFGAIRVRVLFFNYLVDELLGWSSFKTTLRFAYFDSSHFSFINFILGLLGGLLYLDFFFFLFNGFLSSSTGGALEDF